MKIRFLVFLFLISAVSPSVICAEPTYVPSPCLGNMPQPNNGNSWLIDNCVKPLDQIRLVDSNWIDPDRLPRVSTPQKTVKKPVRRYYKKRSGKKIATTPRKAAPKRVARKKTGIPPLTASKAMRPTAAEVIAAQRMEDTTVIPPRLQ